MFPKLKKALLEAGHELQVNYGGGYVTTCPAHADQRPSLSIKAGDDGRALAYCFAGCSYASVLEALGVDLGKPDTAKGIPVDQYTYTDEDGEPLVRVTRFEPKGFSQEHWDQVSRAWVPGVPGDVRRTLYHLPEVLAARSKGQPIYICEGEKDVETARLMGACATTVVGGAKKWRPEYADALRSATVKIVADQDAPGEAHAELLREALRGVAQVAVLAPRSGKDLTDHVFAGHELVDLVDPEAGYWDDWRAEPPEQDWLVDGILERGTINWLYGDRGVAKSMYLQCLGGELSHKGINVTYYDEENPWGTVQRRLWRIQPDSDHFRYKRGHGLDLGDDDQVTALIRRNMDTDLLVFDSFSRVWRDGSDKSSETIVKCINALTRIRNETGATIVMIDHTGHGHWRDDGTIADPTHARGSSAKGQQADMEVQFLEREKWERGKPYRFRIINNKASRVGNPFDINLAIVDTIDGGLECIVDNGIQGQDSIEAPATISPETPVEAGAPAPAPDEKPSKESFKQIVEARRLAKAQEMAAELAKEAEDGS